MLLHIMPRIMSRVAHGFVITAALFLMPVPAAQAQPTSPEVTTISPATTTRPISAAEAAHHIWIKDGRLSDFGDMLRTPDAPRDSMRKVLAATGAEWLARMREGRIQGIQLDPSGKVGIAAEQEAYAQHQIAERLATPGLSFRDRAFTYLSAVRAFADADHPDRLPQAEAYLRQLDALGDSAVYWRYHARASLVYVYYLLGRPSDVIRHGVRAIELGPLMDFVDREALLGEYMYPVVVEALAGQPGGADKIAALNRSLLAAVTLSPALLAQDSGYAYLARYNVPDAKNMIAVNALLGTPGHPLTAQLWLNRPTRDSATIAVNDGKIRIVDVSDYNCLACLLALDRLERLHRKFPAVEVMVVTSTVGHWENRLLSPEEEGKVLTDYFLNYRKLTFPIGIWLAKKAANSDGGLTPESSGPNASNYPHAVRPTFHVLDGKGTIRRIIQGNSDDMEAQLARTVTFLQREANVAATTHNEEQHATR